MRFAHYVRLAVDATERTTIIPPGEGYFTNFEIFVTSGDGQAQVAFGKGSTSLAQSEWLNAVADMTVRGTTDQVTFNIATATSSTEDIYRDYSKQKIYVDEQDICSMWFSNLSGGATPMYAVLIYDWYPKPGSLAKWQVEFNQLSGLDPTALGRDFYQFNNSMYVESIEVIIDITEGTNAGSGELAIEIWEQFEEQYLIDFATVYGYDPFASGKGSSPQGTIFGIVQWVMSAQEAGATPVGEFMKHVTIPVGRTIKKGSLIYCNAQNESTSGFTDMTDATVRIIFNGVWKKDPFRAGSWILSETVYDYQGNNTMR